MGTASRSARSALAPFLFAAVPFVLLVAHFDWLCDDAFISFRFARNLAEGAGLLYNPGLAPVEGYSNFLWVLWLALFELGGLDVTVAARASSAICGVALLWLIARVLRRELDARGTALALLFPATLPPLAIWSTSGLAAMPFALALFAVFERLTAPGRPRTEVAAIATTAAVLVRADGPLFTALLLGALLAWSVRRADHALLRAVLTCGALAGLALATQLLWRHGYYGAWSPNTARVKVEVDALTLERGLKYVGAFLLAFPACLAALLFAAFRRRTPADEPTLAGPATAASLAVAIGAACYAVFVGGDFMTSGRFLVPALPFVAVLFGRSAPGPIAALVVAGLSLPGVWNVQLAPESARRALHFRWSADDYRTEQEQWELMRSQAHDWSQLGRALALHTTPGESLIHGTIGAVGYYSELVIHDPFGLVNREAFREHEEPRRRSPGHHRRVPFATFMALEPTYLEADLVPASEPELRFPRWLRPTSEFGSRAAPEWLSLEGLPAAPAGTVLRLIRRVP